MGYVSPNGGETNLPDLNTSHAPHSAIDTLPFVSDLNGILYLSGKSSDSQIGTLTDYSDFEYRMDNAEMGLNTAIGMDEVEIGMYSNVDMGA